ncbi:tetratricopeptide repeat protein [Prevotella sp. kh1p2]|uniref:tetratricopeptide repeat protein n=1 Tax=Prevotella sp. kh1p2 TaxID=1761883 RepID=UPI0008AB835D|nr:tetratricopeptide repeat protein [Prevotella sp. kh1p2]SET05053.1 TPR repeat-containing protein [Prevotella sp. kh1p2]SNU11760.1 TPR repeat-containing protein [Prevotellaceae bacterium KH2P17]
MYKEIRYILVILLCAFCYQSYAQRDRQYIRNGNKLYRMQNYAKAEVQYRKALTANPQNSQAMYNLGCALMMQQKDSAAVIQYNNAGKLEIGKGRKAMVYHNLGTIFQAHQMYAQAIQAYQESLRNNPNDNETRYNLALCKRQQKNDKQNKNKKKQDNKDKDKEKNKQNQDQKQNQEQQPKEQMSKENAEQLLNAAVQAEKATQQRLKKNMQQPRKRSLLKNW